MKTGNAIFSATAIGAVSLTFGAAQLAFGHDLTGRWQALSGTSQAGVNRTAKADRGAIASPASMSTQTISMRFNGLPDTSVLIRLPLQQEARERSWTPVLIKSPENRSTVACEPSVSVLTEIAKQLAPGRCIT